MLYEKIRITKRILRMLSVEKLECRDCGRVIDEYAFKFPNSNSGRDKYYCKECILSHSIEIEDDPANKLEWELEDEEANLWVLNVNKQSERTL